MKVRTRALYQLLVTLVPFSPGFQTPGPPSACQTRPDHPRQTPPFQTQSKYLSPVFEPPERSSPGWGWQAGCQGKYEAPASRQLPALPRSAHTLHSPGWWQRGEAERGNTTPSSGRKQCGKWVGLLSFGVGVNSPPVSHGSQRSGSSDLTKKTVRYPGNLQCETD